SMSSPFRRHRQNVLARKAAAAAGKRTGAVRNASPAPASAPRAPEGGEAGHEYAALLAVLHDNLRSLSDIQSHEQRQPKKREYADALQQRIEGALQPHQPVQDERLTTNVRWSIDYRQFDYALRLARFVIRHGLALPERYNRTPPCCLAE